MRDEPVNVAPGVIRQDIAAARQRPSGAAITGSHLGRVRIEPPSGNMSRIGGTASTDSFSARIGYVSNVGFANGSWVTPGWAPVYGPGACWTGSTHNGLSFGIGFGTGAFSFGFFYGSSNAPFCSSWSNPWWDGWSGYVAIDPHWHSRHSWSHCGGPWWNNYAWYQSYPGWAVPVYAYTPTYVVPSVTYVNYTSPVVTSVPTYAAPPLAPATYVAPPPSAVELDSWDLLSNGFPRSAAESFSRLYDASPNDARSMVGYAVALAMLDDIAASAAVIREAAEIDASIFSALPLNSTLTNRMQLLADSAEVASRQANMSRDALVALGAWRTALGRYAEAHLAIVVAQQQGDASAGTAALRAWLEQQLGPKA